MWENLKKRMTEQAKDALVRIEAVDIKISAICSSADVHLHATAAERAISRAVVSIGTTSYALMIHARVIIHDEVIGVEHGRVAHPTLS
jgi:hypothetical protein